jgi:hypothetical protein
VAPRPKNTSRTSPSPSKQINHISYPAGAGLTDSTHRKSFSAKKFFINSHFSKRALRLFNKFKGFSAKKVFHKFALLQKSI